MEDIVSMKALFSAFLYSFIGLGLFVFSFHVFDWITPGHFWKELLEERNTALAIVVGAVAIGLSVIVAAAIHG